VTFWIVTKEVGSSHNATGIYSGGAMFEHFLWCWLFLLRSFMDFPSGK
jgi:hypothetical protein